MTLEEAVEGGGEKEVIKAWQTFLGNEWDNKGESRGEGGNGLVIEARPIAPKYFYQERQGCKSCRWCGRNLELDRANMQ